ncbi:MAG: dihydroorotase [Oscillospiraceae bacterium]|nr:dihydroorotase [Oscillospiraceae bacterium]
MLIKNGHLIDKANGLDSVADILIKDGRIAEIGVGLSAEGASVYDASGKYVSPGLIDMHVHLREPGQEYKEDIESGTRAAQKGGFTAVCCMPNTAPVTDSAAVVKFIKDRAKEVGMCKVYPIAAITKGMKGEELSEMGELREAGAIAVSDDGKPVKSGGVMQRAIKYASMFDLPVISHCEEMSLMDGGVMNEGITATSLGLRGISPAVEEVMVSRDILIAEHEGLPVHIAHISTKGSAELVRQGKRRGVKVTCETCPHYFSLTEEAVGDFDTNAKMNPPLRTQEDVDAIIAAIQDGTVDAIVTDHAPHHIDEKRLEFELAMNGIIGLETSLPLGITKLVKTGKITLADLIYLMSTGPAKVLGIEAGEIKVGRAADLTVFDPDEKYTVDVSAFQSKSKNCPYDGMELYGKVYNTILDGVVK